MESISNAKNSELVRFGHYFLGLINDLKRRPEDAAKELNISLENIMDIHYRQFASGLSAPGRNLVLSLRAYF